MSKAKSKAFTRLRTKALSYPETREDLPWGESAIKVRSKTFIFMREDAEGLSLSVKLPRSREFALDYPFTKPTGYGLGNSGWVSSSFGPRETPPMDVLEAWLHESYCTVAPKKLADQVLQATSTPQPPTKTKTKTKTKKTQKKSPAHPKSKRR